jgi:NAD(P)-dependent dehydrogenase (short-subunit alcohol dehydrogenase family)
LFGIPGVKSEPPYSDDAVSALKAENIDAFGYVCDAEDADSIKNFAKKAGELGEIQAVIHAAGVSAHMGSPEKILRVNMLGTVNAVEAFYPLLKAGTVMINIASVNGHTYQAKPELEGIYENPYADDFIAKCLPLIDPEDPQNDAYALSKHFARFFTLGNVKRFGAKGIRIISVSPGAFETPMVAVERKASSSVDAFVSMIPVGRIGEPDEMGAFVSYLCRDDIGFLTGCDIIVDGGSIANIMQKQYGV